MKIGTRVRTLDGEYATVISAARYKAQTGREHPDKRAPAVKDTLGVPVLVWYDNSRRVKAVPEYYVYKVEFEGVIPADHIIVEGQVVYS